MMLKFSTYGSPIPLVFVG